MKFGDGILYDEAATQQYIYQKSIQDPSAPCIPKVYDCFTYSMTTCLVMEFIPFMTIRASTDASYSERVAKKALNWLRNVPAPPVPRLGRSSSQATLP